MGTFDRSKKKIQLWKKALIHFSLCFVMGFFSGFFPTNTSSIFPTQLVAYQPVDNLGVEPAPIDALPNPVDTQNLNRSLMSEISADTPTAKDDYLVSAVEEADEEPEVDSRKLLIIVTATRSDDEFQPALLERLAHTLRLVEAPLLWIVVEAHSGAPKTAKMLRKTGIMYRHLTFKENFTDAAVEADHQRNIALNHIEHHRLAGIVHFAAASNVYDLQFFEEIREIEVFGTWPVAMLSANRKRVVVEGPICSASQVTGWRLKDISSGATTYMRTGASNSYTNNDNNWDMKAPVINISGFAFNSSILWDPERWGRPSADSDISQDSIKFVQQVILEDETKLKGIPSDCSRAMMWHLHIPRNLSLHQIQDRR